MSGAVDEARGYRERAAAVIDALSDDELARNLEAINHLAVAEAYLDQFEASATHAHRAIEVGRATGRVQLFPVVNTLALVLWMQGRITEASETLDDAIEAARLLDNAQIVSWYLMNRGRAALAAGDLDLALTTASESVDVARSIGESILLGYAAVSLAAALLETGRGEEAARLLLTSGGGDELRLIAGGWRASGLELLVRCLLAAGKRPEAERAAEAAAACAAQITLPVATAMAGIAQAHLDLDAGDAALAADRALAAANTLEECGALYHAATSRRLAGLALAQAGRRETAVVELSRAADAFGSFGSSRDHADVERELRKLGHRIHRRTRPGSADGGVDSLTERELQVAWLVVDRKTNPEIADELFLSQKTVETHLRNMFRKLAVSNRVELARAIERARGEGAPAPR